MKKKNLKLNTVFSIIKSISTMLFPLITFPYASRTLLLEGIGKVNFASSITNYFFLLATLGLTPYAIRECSRVGENRNDLERVSSQLMSLNLTTSFISYILLALTLIFAHPLDDYRVLIIVHSTTILFAALGTDWINSAMEDFQYITIRTVAFQLLSLILMFLFVKTPDDFLVYALISVLSSSGAHLTNIFYRRRYCRIRFTVHMDLKKHLPPIFTLFAMQLAQTIFTNADITMLGLIHSDSEVGLYSTALKVYNIVSQLILSILWVVMPRLSVYYAQKDYSLINSLLRKILGFTLTLGLPCITGLNMLADEIIEIVGGAAFLPSAPVLRLLTISLFFSLLGTNFIGNVIMLPSQREKHFLYACCLAAIVNVIINALLIPKWHIYGAAIATIIASALIFVLLLPKIEKQVHMGNLLTLAGAPVVGCAMIVLVCMIVRYFTSNLWLRTILCCGLSCGAYGITLLLMRYEMVDFVLNCLNRKLKKL